MHLLTYVYANVLYRVRQTDILLFCAKKKIIILIKFFELPSIL